MNGSISQHMSEVGLPVFLARRPAQSSFPDGSFIPGVLQAKEQGPCSERFEAAFKSPLDP